MMNHLTFLPLLITAFLSVGAFGFTAPCSTRVAVQQQSSAAFTSTYSRATITPKFAPATVALHSESSDDAAAADPNEVIARRIIVLGDVDGGYYRSCVKNEASRFRKLIGTMSPPDDSNRAEIYVEGKRKFVDGFVRWCERGDVGLSQQFTVDEVIDEFPTGMYDEFYVNTGR